MGDGHPAAHMISMTATIHTPATSSPTPPRVKVSGSSRDANYRAGVDHLWAYVSVSGHANMPKRHVTDDGFKLGTWVTRRRRDRSAGVLSAERITELDALGMVWGSSRDANYRTGVNHFRTFVTTSGHARVPRGFVTDNGFKLGSWVGSRREDRKNGRLSAVKIAELSALGMVWDYPDAGYRIGVDHLRAYVAVSGHANVHRRHVTADGFTLGAWVETRRRDRKIGRLSTTRIAELNALGMVWHLRDANYRTGLDHLRAYAATQGHANVPAIHADDDGFKLGVWVHNRRNDRKIGRLSTTRIAELNALGMVWRSSHSSHSSHSSRAYRVAGHRTGVDHLRAYTAAQGHANVPRKFVTDDGFTLGVWVNSRRKDRKAGTLSATRIAELNALGMVWDAREANYRTGVDHLRDYTAVHARGDVPWGFVADDGFTLGRWVSNRRRDHKVRKLTTARIAELSALGMVWNPRAA